MLLTNIISIISHEHLKRIMVFMGEVLHFNLVEHQRTITVRKIETEISFKIKLIKIMKFFRIHENVRSTPSVTI